MSSEIEMLNKLGEQPKAEETPAAEEPTQEQHTEEVSTETPQEEQVETTAQPTKEEQPSSLTETPKAEEETTPAPKFDVKEWLKTNKETIDLVTRDFDTLDFESVDTSHDLLINKLKREGYSEEEAQVLLEERYPTIYDDEADEEDEDVIKKSNSEFIKMKREAKQYADELKSKAAEANLDLPIDESYNQQVIKNYLSQVQKQNQDYQTQARQANANLGKELVKEFNELKFDLGEGSVVNYVLSDDDSKRFVSEMEDYRLFFDRNFSERDEKGNIKSFNKEGFVKAMFAAMNAEQLLKIAYNGGAGKGRKDFIKNDLKNSTIESGSKPREDSPNDLISQGAKLMKEGKLKLT